MSKFPKHFTNKLLISPFKKFREIRINCILTFRELRLSIVNSLSNVTQLVFWGHRTTVYIDQIKKDIFVVLNVALLLVHLVLMHARVLKIYYEPPLNYNQIPM